MLQDVARLTGGKAITEDLDIPLRNIQISDLGQAKKIWDAAAVASCCAAASVEAEGGAGIPDRAALEARLAAYRRRQGA